MPLSQSLIWQRQRDYYARRGLGAWSEDNVPNYVTNNTFIAEIYARIVCAFICDCLNLTPDKSSPPVESVNFRILELGSGSGKFAYLFLRHLMPLLESKHIPSNAVHYCMTDCCASLLDWWRRNEQLKRFVAAGHLTFELLELGHESGSEFLRSCDGPLITFANYVFDSVPQDAFLFRDETIFETVVTTSVPVRSDGELPLSSLERSFRQVPSRTDHYTEPEWNEILRHYAASLSGATVLFPTAALQTIKKLKALSDGRLLVLAGDKGFVHEDDFSSAGEEPYFEFHQANCFSQTVNFDALGRDCRARGGQALLPDKHSSNFSIVALVFGLDNPSLTRAVYRETQEGFGVDDLFALMAWLRPHVTSASAAELLAVLRLTRWDPVALMELFQIFNGQLPTTVAQRHDLQDAVRKVWNNNYPVTEAEKSLAFNCGAILLQLGFCDEARAMFERSQEILGPSAATSYNLYLCALAAGSSGEALRFAREATRLDPGFQPAGNAVHELEAHEGNLSQ